MKYVALFFLLMVAGLFSNSEGICEPLSGPENPGRKLQPSPVTASDKKDTMPATTGESTDDPMAEKSDDHEEKDAAEKPGVNKKMKEKKHPPDRRWILKMKKKPIPAAKKVPLSWASEDQRERCEKIGEQLRKFHRNARDYSIRGDGCNTAAYAKRFLEGKKVCERQCPSGFLESNGFSPTVFKNIETLLELGNKRCLGFDSGRKR